MDIQTEKIELYKKLVTQGEYWGDLSDKVILNAEESIRQINAGMGIPHEKVRETYLNLIKS